MSSHQFLEVLRSIDCPDVSKLTPESIDWMFENEAAHPLLTWFCDCINSKNTISSPDLNLFKTLELTGQVLEGKQLVESLNYSSAGSPLSEKELLSSVEELKSSVERSKSRKTLLTKRCNKLSMQHLELKNQVSQMEKVEDHWARQRHVADDKCREDNAKLGDSLQQLSQSVEELMKLYESQSGMPKKTPGPEDRPFLSQTELDAFYEAEAKFFKELTAFTKKQFFSGMAEMAGAREDTEYNLLDISTQGDPALDGLSQDEDDGGFLDNCREFSRLQKIFPKSELARINALINAKKAASAVGEARSILHKLKSGLFPSQTREISSLRHASEQSASALRAECTPLVTSLPDLVTELGGLQGTEILTGDYDLKMKRQDYFMKSQDKVIEHLVSQRARYEFLSMLYDLELEWHKDTHGLLSAARQTLETHLYNWQNRMSELDEPDLSEKKLERGVVDTRDTSMARLFQLIGNGQEDEKRLYLPNEKVLSEMKTLKSEYDTAVADDKNRVEHDFDKVKSLGQCVSKCEDVLYGDSSTSGGQPPMTPGQIQSALTRMSSNLATLEARIMEVVEQVNTRKAKLRENILQKKERELFILFHTNPEKLKFVINGLAERGKAALKLQDS